MNEANKSIPNVNAVILTLSTESGYVLYSIKLGASWTDSRSHMPSYSTALLDL